MRPICWTGMFDGMTAEKSMRAPTLLAALAIATSSSAMWNEEVHAPSFRRRERDLTPEEKEAQMRRELADCQAHKARLAAAAEKRARKAAKRLKNMPSNAELTGRASEAGEGPR